MLLKQINLKNFRNFTLEKFNFSPFLTIIIGENARGKTNLLEAAYLASQGVGFRESKEEELIKFEENNAFIQADFTSGDVKFDFRIDFAKTETGVKKIFSINGVKRRHFQYQRDSAKIVLFSPEQIEIMTGSPDKRRKYFNLLLSSLDYEYKKKLSNYEKALRKRNKILEKYHSEMDLEIELKYWDELLEQEAKKISSSRQKYADYLNKEDIIDSKTFSITYLQNRFDSERLEKYRELEKRIRKTVIGPQKDDFQVNQVNRTVKDLHRFGSRSEQRLGIFWLKFNEIKYLEKFYTQKPLLLLDDIFSELDLKNKKLIIDLVRKYQTVVTTTEAKLLELAEIPKLVIKI